jgi:predicted secreted protein
MKKLLRIICALTIIGVMSVPASAQIVLSVYKGSTIPITLVENPSIGKWTFTTTSGLQVVSNTFSNGYRMIKVKALKAGLQTISGIYYGKSRVVIDRLSKTVNVLNGGIPIFV